MAQITNVRSSYFPSSALYISSINYATSYYSSLTGKKIEQLNENELKTISASLLKEAQKERYLYIRNAILITLTVTPLIIAFTALVTLPFCYLSSKFIFLFLGGFSASALCAFLFKDFLADFLSLYQTSHLHNSEALKLLESSLLPIKQLHEASAPAQPASSSSQFSSAASASSPSSASSSQSAQAVAVSSPAPSTPYASLLGNGQVKKSTEDEIRAIFTYISENGKATLLWNKSALEERSRPMQALHPLKVIGLLFSDPTMKSHFKNIYNDYFKRTNCLSKLEKKLNEKLNEGNLHCYLPDFAQEVNIDPNILKPYFLAADWDGMIKFLIFG